MKYKNLNLLLLFFFTNILISNISKYLTWFIIGSASGPFIAQKNLLLLNYTKNKIIEENNKLSKKFRELKDENNILLNYAERIEKDIKNIEKEIEFHK